MKNFNSNLISKSIKCLYLINKCCVFLSLVITLTRSKQNMVTKTTLLSTYSLPREHVHEPQWWSSPVESHVTHHSNASSPSWCFCTATCIQRVPPSLPTHTQNMCLWARAAPPSPPANLLQPLWLLEITPPPPHKKNNRKTQYYNPLRKLHKCATWNESCTSCGWLQGELTLLTAHAST